MRVWQLKLDCSLGFLPIPYHLPPCNLPLNLTALPSTPLSFLQPTTHTDTTTTYTLRRILSWYSCFWSSSLIELNRQDKKLICLDAFALLAQINSHRFQGSLFSKEFIYYLHQRYNSCIGGKFKLERLVYYFSRRRLNSWAVFFCLLCSSSISFL